MTTHHIAFQSTTGMLHTSPKCGTGRGFAAPRVVTDAQVADWDKCDNCFSTDGLLPADDFGIGTAAMTAAKAHPTSKAARFLAELADEVDAI